MLSVVMKMHFGKVLQESGFWCLYIITYLSLLGKAFCQMMLVFIPALVKTKIFNSSLLFSDSSSGKFYEMKTGVQRLFPISPEFVVSNLDIGSFTLLSQTSGEKVT